MDQIAKNRQDFDRKLQQIRSNTDLNDEAKRRMISELTRRPTGATWNL